MDDIRRSNLLFLAGVASLAAQGCGDAVASRQVRSAPSGNPLEKDNSLTGADDAEVESTLCRDFARQVLECDASYGYEYGSYELANLASYCALLLDDARRFGPDCGDAARDWFACVAEQDCQSFACSREDDLVDRACSTREEFETTGF